MWEKKRRPIGVEDFGDIRKGDFYYIDKTGLIRELLYSWSDVTLFTRPRRFGKTLNMSMLKYFFEIGSDPMLFDGLEISKEKELCEKYMGKFPVISISLKGAAGADYETARAMLCFDLAREAARFGFLRHSEQLDAKEKERYSRLLDLDTMEPSALSDQLLMNSLRLLSELLHNHYGRKVILLIDEYDVPLERAQYSGYYAQMADLIRNLFHQSLKTNGSLFFAVLTGCLRISKESIFTGLNNLRVLSIPDVRFDESFGFTDREVRDFLDYYGLSERYSSVKEWYDGYRFGSVDVYCPWDVLNYADLLCVSREAEPEPFWINSSGNDIVRNFISRASAGTKREIERLIDGESIEKKIFWNFTYQDLYSGQNNFWSILFMTGYLTCREDPSDGYYRLVIPNREIRQIFIEQVLEWFQEEARRDTPKLDALCQAFQDGDAAAAEERFCAFLRKTISIRDTSVRKDRKENFYHGILLGLLSHREDWTIESNAESGDGFSDILIEIGEEQIGIVIEVKYPDGRSLDAGCREALEQIERLGYKAKLRENGMTQILSYGVACSKKRCRIMCRQEKAGRPACAPAGDRGGE